MFNVHRVLFLMGLESGTKVPWATEIPVQLCEIWPTHMPFSVPQDTMAQRVLWEQHLRPAVEKRVEDLYAEDYAQYLHDLQVFFNSRAVQLVGEVMPANSITFATASSIERITAWYFTPMDHLYCVRFSLCMCCSLPLHRWFVARMEQEN